MAGTGTRLFLSGEIAYASDINTFLMDQVITVFLTPNERDAAFGDGYPTTEINPGTSTAGTGKPALSEGRFCYIKFQNDGTTPLKEVQYYNGSTWVSSSQFTVADGSITEAKIANNAVTSSKIAANSINSSHIAAGTIIASDIGDDSVTTGKILNGAVTNAKLASTSGSEAVTTSVIRDDAITSAKLASDLTFEGDSTFNGSVNITGTSFIAEIIEKVHVDTSPTSTTDIDMLEAGIHYFATSHSSGFVLNFTGDGVSTFDDLTSVGQSVTGVVLITSGSTSGRPTAIEIDGEEIADVKWFGGVQFPDGSGNGDVDSYTITIIKTAATPTYLVLASQSRFA